MNSMGTSTAKCIQNELTVPPPPQLHRKHRPHTWFALQQDITAHLPCKVSGNGKPQTIALYAAVAGVLHRVEPLKHAGCKLL